TAARTERGEKRRRYYVFCVGGAKSPARVAVELARIAVIEHRESLRFGERFGDDCRVVTTGYATGKRRPHRLGYRHDHRRFISATVPPLARVSFRVCISR